MPDAGHLPPSGPLLDVRGLSVGYRERRALDGIDLAIAPGEVVALVGESGCGKSTVALAILRLLRAPGKIVGGRIAFRGEDLAAVHERRMRQLRGGGIGIVFQNPTTYLNPMMTIGRQLIEAARLHLDIDVATARIRAREMLDRVQIVDAGGVLRRYPHELSGGMNQRVMIAMAMIAEPALLILDEPTTALDVTVQREITDLLFELKRDSGMGMLFITHDLGLVAELADRAYVLYAGRVMESASVDDLFGRAVHPYTRALLAAVPRVDRAYDRFETIEGAVPWVTADFVGCRFANRCPRAFDRCRAEAPPLHRHALDHHAACWLEGP